MESIERKHPRPRGMRRGRGVRARGGGTRTVRPGPRTIDEITIYDISDMPLGQGLERPLHPYRKQNHRRKNSKAPTVNNIEKATPSVAQDSYATTDYNIEKATPSSKSKSKVKLKKSIAQDFSSYATTNYNIEKATPSSKSKSKVKFKNSIAQDSYTTTDYNMVEAGPSSVAHDFSSKAATVYNIVEATPASNGQDFSSYTTTDYNLVEAEPSSVAHDFSSNGTTVYNIVEATPASDAQDFSSYTTTVYNMVEAGPSSVAPEEQAQVDPIWIEIKSEAQDDLSDTNGELAPCEAAQLPSQSLQEKIIFQEFNYGSEDDTDESDDEESPPLFIPRAQCSFLGSLIDDDDDDQPTAEPEPAAEYAATSTLDVPATETEQPWSLFDFDWKPFPNDPFSPKSRRETFSHKDVGPTAPCVDPYDIFISIWDRQFMEYIASETNRYAQQLASGMFETNLHLNSRISRWKDTTVDELYVYFALVLGMGVVVKTRVEEYWSVASDLFHTPNFSTYMSYARFVLLGRCLHFANNEAMYGLELDSSEAKLFKIQPVLSHLNDKFQSLYRLKQNIALDESLLMWKGCLSVNQLIPNKKAEMGIKTYEICEPQTGYLWRFEVHVPNSPRSPSQLEDPLIASTPAMVLKLIQDLEGKGHTLWMDNSYNSPCLARRLKSLGLDCVGTLRTNRKFVPQALHSLNKEDMLPGQMTGLTAGDVDVMVWRDNKKVAMISTYHGNAVSEGTNKPILIHDYNIMMGGVDKKDQMLSMYQIERKRTKTWYKKLFRRLLNVSVLNSFIIHQQSSSSPLTHRNFRKTLINILLFKHSSKTILKPSPVKPHQRHPR